MKLIRISIFTHIIKRSGTYPHKTEQDVTPPNKKPDTKPYHQKNIHQK
ncbi:virion structural protein [Staphylococcus phage S-CoN_Ph35]|nr:virion structural protein [Staphylococcus phage S-CoN_Ph35]